MLSSREWKKKILFRSCLNYSINHTYNMLWNSKISVQLEKVAVCHKNTKISLKKLWRLHSNHLCAQNPSLNHCRAAPVYQCLTKVTNCLFTELHLSIWLDLLWFSSFLLPTAVESHPDHFTANSLLFLSQQCVRMFVFRSSQHHLQYYSVSERCTVDPWGRHLNQKEISSLTDCFIPNQTRWANSLFHDLQWIDWPYRDSSGVLMWGCMR